MIITDIDKNILILGGTGFLGQELVKSLDTSGYRNITVFARDEGKLMTLKEQYPYINIISGDLSDKFEVYQSMIHQDYIFHLAAFKHVGFAQIYSRECIKSNLIGTLNVLECSMELKPEFVITTSTDKAAQISGVYGASKYLAEELYRQYEIANKDTMYRVVRYGNVLYSTGSVLCIWKNQIQRGEPVMITDPDATRFFWTVTEAVALLFECLRDASDSKPYCPSMKSMAMGDLLQAMIEKYAEGREIIVHTTRLKEGENEHERLLKEGPSSAEVERFTIAEIKELI